MIKHFTRMFGGDKAAKPAADAGADVTLTGESLSRGPVAHPPARAALPHHAAHSRNGHSHGHGHPHEGHKHANGHGSGLDQVSGPARGVIARAPQRQKDIPFTLPAEFAKSKDHAPAQSVSICCDKYENWAPVPLERGADGAWRGKITIPEHTTWIHYFFEVDGSHRVLDPNPEVNKVSDPAKGRVSLKNSRY